MERIDGGDDGGPRLKKGSSASMQVLRTGTRQSATMELLDRSARRGEAGGYAGKQAEETAVAAMVERRSSNAWGRGKDLGGSQGVDAGVLILPAAPIVAWSARWVRRRPAPVATRSVEQGRRPGGVGWLGRPVSPRPSGGYRGGFLFYLNSFAFLFFYNQRWVRKYWACHFLWKTMGSAPFIPW